MSSNAHTLTDVFARNARIHGNMVAFQHTGTVTHREYFQRSEQLAAGLSGAGIRHGDRVAIVSRNRMVFMELVGAAARLGAIVCAVNWRLSALEVSAVLENDEPSMVLVEDEFWSLLAPVAGKAGAAVELVSIESRRAGFRSIGDFYLPGGVTHDLAVGPDDPLLFIHTAWSDDRPKAAMLSHRNLIANAIQLQLTWGLKPQDVHLCCLPLFHSTAISLTLATQMAGGSSVLMPKYDASEAVVLIQEHKVTLFAEFAPMLDGMLSVAGDAAIRLGSVRHVCGLDSPDTIKRFEAVCPASTFWAGYGQTEASGLVSLAPFRDAPGAAGFGLPLASIEIVGEDGQPLSDGEVGEIAVRGTCVFLGYWRRPADNALVFRDGCLHTGDSGYFDGLGRLWYSGRLASKELIKTGGENVYPAEVEAVLRQHPALLDVAVIGVADAKWGESVLAVCVGAKGEMPSEQDVIDFVGERIARYKRPRKVVFVPGLPKKADGTNDRERIRQLHG